MRSFDDASACWERIERIQNLKQLREALTATTDGQPYSSLRSLSWKICLLFSSFDHSRWFSALADTRAAYSSLRDHFLKAIEHPDEIGSATDPLSDNIESPWVALRQDETLRDEIQQDVDRTMPDNLYFHQPTTQRMLVDILFIFCKLNPDVGYRQGMHEVLALVLWVVERDAIAPPHNTPNDSKQDYVRRMFSAQYIEHDAFSLFAVIMQQAKAFYDPTSSGSGRGDSPILRRCKRIFEVMLPTVDPGLASHLENLDVLPQLFLMRWIRLLFSREFPFDSTLALWDLIFLEDPSLEIVNLVCVAMLLRVRWQLTKAHSTEALGILMHYPQLPEPHQPSTLLEDALELRHDLTIECGQRIVKRYSGRVPPLIDSAKRPRSPQSLMPSTSILSRAISSSSLAQRASQSIGFEALLQDAAKEVALKSERWGVNKAVKDAIESLKQAQSIPSGRSSPATHDIRHPRRTTGAGRLVQSQGTHTPSDELGDQVQALESRNKTLAKVLENAIAQLWTYQATMAEHLSVEQTRKNESLVHAIAKVHLVQVCLGDTTIPVPEEDVSVIDSATTLLESSLSGESTTQASERSDAAAPRSQNLDAATENTPESNSIKSTPLTHITPSSAAPPPISAQQPPITSTTSTTDTPTSTTPLNEPDSNLVRRPRAPLAQSSFAWMLEPGERRSDVASRIAEHDKPRSGSKASIGKRLLFGDSTEEESSSTSNRGSKGKGVEGAGDAEAIDLGAL